jgi:hypothetical protein
MTTPEPGDDRRTVVVSRSALIGGAASLGACLLVIAFLLGRQCSHRADAARSAPYPAGPAPGAPGASSAGNDGTTWPPGNPEAPATQDPPATAGPGDRETVARYFAQVESIEARAKTWSDPTSLAQTILRQAVDGDASGFDSLIAAQREARTALTLLVPPEPCRPHLDRTVELLDEATSLLEGLRNQILAGDLEGLATVAIRAQAMEGKAQQVDALAAGIKKRFGL